MKLSLFLSCNTFYICAVLSLKMGELVSGCKGSENDWENDPFSFDQIEGKQEKIVFTCRN